VAPIVLIALIETFALLILRLLGEGLRGHYNGSSLLRQVGLIKSTLVAPPLQTM